MKYSRLLPVAVLAACLTASAPSFAQAQAQPDLKVNTPAAATLRAALKERNEILRPHLESGAIGIGQDGRLAVHDPSLVPLSERQKIQSLMSAENADWSALYQEIANANGHPEWADQIRDAFKVRRMERAAQRGWWVQGPDGWTKK